MRLYRGRKEGFNGLNVGGQVAPEATTALQAKVARLRVEKGALSATVVVVAPKIVLVDATFAQSGEIEPAVP